MGDIWHLDPATARLIAAQRRPKERACAVCGKPFTTIGRGLFCSDRCKRRAEYLRLKEKQHATS